MDNGYLELPITSRLTDQQGTLCNSSLPIACGRVIYRSLNFLFGQTES